MSQPAVVAASACFAMLQFQWPGSYGDAVPLVQPHTRLGRHPSNDIVVEHPSISGDHLEIILAAGGVLVRDPGSHNGTTLNGRRLPVGEATAVAPGATLCLAGVLELSLMPPAPNLPLAILPARYSLLPRPQPGLVIWQQNGEQQRVVLSGRRMTLGRAPDNDIVIANNVVSAHHAEIVPQNPTQYIINDLGSRNGILSDGKMVRGIQFQPGQPIYISDQIMISYSPALGFAIRQDGDRQPAAAAPLTLDAGARAMIRIGRAADNDLRIDDPRVSRYHAIVERVGARYRVRDLHSDNGTFVNGQQVEKERFLVPGDVLQLAGTKVQFGEDGLSAVDLHGGLRMDLLNLRKEVAAGRTLLQDISLSIYPHEFVALVGTSGAGKSTLLDAMNGFRPASHGRVLINGDDLYRHFDAYRTELGYVPQDDIMHRELSVYEALDFAARLRMPADSSARERRDRIHQVLRELDMENRQDLPIHKLSGGQRKRVSIGIELLTRPSLFFLDEATSGLDPATELELMHLLRRLADDSREGRTVILITHATKNVMLCDKVIILTKGGYLAFYGPPDEALQHFESYRSAEDRKLNPDFEFDDIYRLIDPDRALPATAAERDKVAMAATWAERFRRSAYHERYVAGRLRAAPHPGEPGSSNARARKKPHASSLRQFFILSRRHWAVMRRDFWTLLVLLLVAPVIAITQFTNYGKAIFNPVDGSPANAMTILFLAVIIVMLYGTVTSAREITKEIPVYRRERMINLGIAPYVASKVFVGLLFCIYSVAVYLAITLLSIDWPHMSPHEWGQFYLTLLLASVSGMVLGLLLSAMASTDGQAVSLIPVILIPQFMFAGVMLPDLGKVPVIPKLMTSYWATGALATITHADLAGSLSPDAPAVKLEKMKAGQQEAAEAVRTTKIQAEVDRIVAERLDAETQKALEPAVTTETDRVIAGETARAQAEAEAKVLNQLSAQPDLPQEQRDAQVQGARQQAAQAVAERRDQIAGDVRAQLEPQVRLRVEKELRLAVFKEVNAKAPPAVLPEGPKLPTIADQFGDVFHVNIYKSWAAMMAIMAGLLGIILLLQKRKDVI